MANNDNNIINITNENKSKAQGKREGDEMPSSSEEKEVNEEETEKAKTTWQKWVPMDSTLFGGVQLIHLLMLQTLDEMLSEAGIPYWITGGTLIGAIRHNGFIPHDDDVDIECFQKDLDRIADLSTIEPFYTGFTQQSGKWEGHPVAKLLFFDGMFSVDVFPRPDDLPGPPLEVVDEENNENSFPFPSKSEVFPLTRYPFHNIQVWGPNKEACITYLNRLYDPDWKECVCVWNHDFNWFYNKGFDRRKVTLPLVEYNRIIEMAGVYNDNDNNPLLAENTAKETYEKFQTLYNCSKQRESNFFENFQKYKSQRTWRLNQADAEWRYKQQYGDDDSSNSDD